MELQAKADAPKKAKSVAARVVLEERQMKADAEMKDNGIGRRLCEDDTDDILSQRTRTRVVKGAKTSTWLNKQGLVVSKLNADAAVDLDDPLFWQKVMPDFVTPTLLMNQLLEMTEAFDKKSSGKSLPGKQEGKKVLANVQTVEECVEINEKNDVENNDDPEDDDIEMDETEKEPATSEKKFQR
eukprot:CAMPEP_0172416212 /NCGR_PEP_ID=MMETSP1064-20121228/2687_1 /TAXON_ID=202472 /ORGANISM="Aulacoseira subarctica , Strain CCAP 1002/5" /LENGTH=183 /DNA_ID=CAMNT_0013153713 /DNA_START=255 /DNA_END=808 /DNA_ORIENTATION=-